MDNAGAHALTKGRAKHLRQDSTRAEAALWEIVRGNRTGVKFRRQHAFGAAILDFYCAPLRLAVECDGPVHDDRVAEDDDRDRWLATLGLTTLRLTNDEILFSPAESRKRIAEAIAAFQHPNSE